MASIHACFAVAGADGSARLPINRPAKGTGLTRLLCSLLPQVVGELRLSGKVFYGGSDLAAACSWGGVSPQLSDLIALPRTF